jgi:hypothetical protein
LACCAASTSCVKKWTRSAAAEAEGGGERAGLSEVGGVLAVGFEVLDAAGEALYAGIVGGERPDGLEGKRAVMGDAVRMAVGLAGPLCAHERLILGLLRAFAVLSHRAENGGEGEQQGEEREQNAVGTATDEEGELGAGDGGDGGGSAAASVAS